MITDTLHCRWCAGSDLVVVLDLGRQPPADLFPAVDAPGPDPTAPLRMGRCADCGLAQLLEDPGVAEEVLGREPAALVQQAESAVDAIAGLRDAATTFVEFDSPHGGGWRSLLTATGLQDRTDDPSGTGADLVVDVFGLMHDPDQRTALAERVARLSEDGVLLLQFHSVATIVAQRQWNALRHGHLAYYATAILAAMLAELGLHPFEVWEFELYGGTVLLAASRRQQPRSARLAELIDREHDRVDAAGLVSLAAAAREAADDLRRWLDHQLEQGSTVLGYGAASRAVPLLGFAGITADQLPAVADGSPKKWGRCLPGSRIPIISPAELRRRDPDAVVLFVPDLAPEVRAALPDLRAQWWVTEPRLRMIS